MIEKFKVIKNFCINTQIKKELWPTYYNRRYLEFLSYYETLPKKNFINALELGCGIGYNTAFISKIASNVVATDLETIDPITHSPGLEITREFLRDLNITNVEIKHATAETLPFPDNSFDLVVSVHVLEHVPDREKAIQEINRVLKKDGLNFCVVPTRMNRFYDFFANYIYILNRIIYHLLVKRFKKSNDSTLEKGVTKDNRIIAKKLFMKSFPFPPAHGAFKNYISELNNWSFHKWENLITANGKYELLNSSSSQIFPFLPLLGSISPLTAVSFHALTRRIESFFGKLPFIKTFGISAIIITRKC